jgi:hypothetical protein
VSPAGGDPLATVFLSRTGCGARLIGQFEKNYLRAKHAVCNKRLPGGEHLHINAEQPN